MSAEPLPAPARKRKRQPDTDGGEIAAQPEAKRARPDEAPSNAAAAAAASALPAATSPLRTLAIALPGSIVDACLTHELATSLVGRIGRAAAMFRVTEIVVFCEGRPDVLARRRAPHLDGSNGELFLYKLLCYMETPPYLRKAFFPISPDLRHAGLLPALDIPSHSRVEETSAPWREGVVLKKAISMQRDAGSWVDVGLGVDCAIDRRLQPGVRVTVRMDERSKKHLAGTAVSPHAPGEAGTYWGYTVRLAASLERVFSECPHEGGYDLRLGAAEQGASLFASETRAILRREYSHAVLVFGGADGLQGAVEADTSLRGSLDSCGLFDALVNTIPDQGVRTVHTDEAVLLSLAALQPHLRASLRGPHENATERARWTNDRGWQPLE